MTQDWVERYLQICREYGLDPGIVVFDENEDRPAYYGSTQPEEEEDD